MNSFFSAIRRKPDNNPTTNKGAASGATLPIRLSGTSPNQEASYERNPRDGELGGDNPNGRSGNDWTYPDYPRGEFRVNVQNGDRLQDFANTHLSEGEAPGKIPRGWQNRFSGKLGTGITGNPVGDNFFMDTITGQDGGGIGDMRYIPHTPTPRNSMVARPFLRTVDDYAPIPGVFVADATRR